MELLVFLQSMPSVPPISAFLLCFIPLALVIVGFIVAGKFTDGQATSSYLRILPTKSDASDTAS